MKTKRRRTVVATMTIQPDLLKKIKEKVQAEDMTLSQYFRLLAKRDLGNAAEKQAA